MAEQIEVARIVERTADLEVFLDIRPVDRGTRGLVGFDRVLIDRGIDQTQIVNDAAGLRAKASIAPLLERFAC